MNRQQTETTLRDQDLSFQHLQLELARLDILLHRQVHRQQILNAQNEDQSVLSRYHVSEAEAYELLQRPLGVNAGTLTGDDDDAYREALDEVESSIAALVTVANQRRQQLRLQRLAILLGLNRFELDVLLISIATDIDLRYGKIYAFLQDDLTRKRPTPNLLLELLCEPGPDRLLYLSHFSAKAPLMRHHLLTRLEDTSNNRPVLLSETLIHDESIAAWLLLGQYEPAALLQKYLDFVSNPEPDQALLPADICQAMKDAASTEAVLVFTEQDVVGQRIAAGIVAQQRNQPLLTLSLAGAVEAAIDPLDAIRLLLRDALLVDAVPHITGWDSVVQDAAPMPGLLDVVCDHPRMVIIAGRQVWQPRQIERSRLLRWYTFESPDFQQRRRLLQQFLEDSKLDPAVNIDNVAGQFLLTTGQLRDAVQTAWDMASQKDQPLMDQHLFAAARLHSNPRLGALARKITPRFTWEDLILPVDQIAILREMVNTIRSRPLVLEEWGVGEKLTSSAGITALYAGEPGTGKTMAAEVIAGELGLDLYKIDLSSMVSKYIGETEKNLERIFNEAESSNAILFFDEADAIFGKRSEVKDAHDRYANIEVSYLLQRMERYNGVTILATNLRANLDDAFTRRLQFTVDFAFPKKEDRLRIWQALFPPGVPADPNLDLALMADRFRLPGGNIRNIIVSAAYLAATNGQLVTMEHLMHGARRELQKMGRLVDEKDLEVPQE